MSYKALYNKISRFSFITSKENCVCNLVCWSFFKWVLRVHLQITKCLLFQALILGWCLKQALCRRLLSQFVWVHPSVCALIAEAHLLHQIISLCRTTAIREREYETHYTSCHFVNNPFQKNKRVSPPVFVFDGCRLLGLDLMKKRSEDSPGFPQLVTLIK